MMKYLFLIFLFVNVTISYAQLVAFPGAEGFGRFTTGGRGGQIIEVTNLNDSGPGSLREAINVNAPRIIVFRVSGTIILKSSLNIKYGNLTIAGQTAPGDGICLRDYPMQNSADNVIVRYMRFRLGDVTRQESDSFWGVDRKNIIIDHCSFSWAIDENGSFYDNVDFTMQWCLNAESMYHSYHSKGDHGYGGIWGGSRATFHHNLIASNSSRNPRFNGSRYKPTQPDTVDFVNNVIFNWGFNSIYGGEAGNQNIRNNYYKYGPATTVSVRNRIVEPSDTAGNWYIAGNYVFGSTSVTTDNWAGVQGTNAAYQRTKKRLTPFPFAPVTTHSAEEAYQIVLESAGASFPKRDTVDSRIVNSVITGLAPWGATYGGGMKGIIDSQNDVGGWPQLNSSEPPVDSDHDGMPDSWEIQQGLDPNNPNDRNNIAPSGYTYVEEYINGLVSQVTNVHDDIKINSIELHNNYPNPFNPETTIIFELKFPAFTQLYISDITGRRIKTLVNDFRNKGVYYNSWNGKSDDNVPVAAGVYLCTLSSADFSKTIKIQLLK